MGMGSNHFNMRDRPRKLATLARAIWGHRSVRIAVGFWGMGAAYDTALSEWVPESWAAKAPKLREIIAMTSGFFSISTWLLVLAAILVISSLEYAHRRTGAQGRSQPPPTSEPNVVATQYTRNEHLPLADVAPIDTIKIEPEPSYVDEFGRIFVGSNVTPAYLVGLFKQGTAIQGAKQTESYIGKWMKLSGFLDDVLPSTGIRVMVTFRTNNSLHNIIMYFNVT